MKVTLTLLHLRKPWHFFALSYQALHIIQQLKGTPVKETKTQGLGSKHYTMSLWEQEEDMKTFARSGAHLEAMKGARKIAKEIRVLTLDQDTLPDWYTAKKLLMEKGKVYTY
ncbi:MAG TPA: DUF3291 domain-containing protein [Cytophagales bacterium]|nr:DUF3291 domain-containing protein [Cytophagales bacterium]HAA22511.1 DUF3291 domain-containing protein [Cytophagales bacterium]HAP61381.1 DUF3291 domain-containing protein [Cytophagales bacterium]